MVRSHIFLFLFFFKKKVTSEKEKEEKKKIMLTNIKTQIIDERGKANKNIDSLTRDKEFDSIMYILNNDCRYCVNSQTIVYGFKESTVRKLTDVNKNTLRLIGILTFWFFFIHCAASTYVLSYKITKDPVRANYSSWFLFTACLLFVMISAPLIYRQKYLAGKILSVISMLCMISSIMFLTFKTLNEIRGNDIIYFYVWTLFTTLSAPNAELYFIISKFIKRSTMSNFMKFITELTILAVLMIPISFCISYFRLPPHIMFHLALALIPIIVSVVIIALRCLLM